MTARPAVLRAGHPQVFLADISEFQPDIADAAYLAWSKAIIIRAMYGDAHDDGAWYGGARRAALHAGGVRFLGIYQFIDPDQDPAAQAHALVDLLGPLQPGELPIADLETGGPGQAARWAAWEAVIREAYGISPWLYSGLNFSLAHGLHPQWVAAYQVSPPHVPYLMWQFTDAFPVPGVGSADCSVFSGTIGDLAAHAWQGKPAPPPAPSPLPADWQEKMMNKLPVLRLGDRDSAEPWFVRRVQGLCNAMLPDQQVTIDGDLGPATENAVTRVQHEHGVTADGIVGPVTWSVLVTGSVP